MGNKTPNTLNRLNKQLQDTIMQDALDAMMGFDPSKLNVFNNDSNSRVNPNIYKTNPNSSKDSDGIYRSKVRILYNPYDYSKSIVSKTEWYCKGSNGSFLVNAPLDTRENNRTNPLAIASSKVFLASEDFAELFAFKMFPTNPAKRTALLGEFNSITGRGKEAWAQKFKGTELGKMILDYAKTTFDNTTSTWVLVQILEDNNKPELVGQIKMMKIAKDILDKLQAKMNPSEVDRKNGVKPVDLMSWVLGYPLEMKVVPGEDDPQHPERKQREISYALCDFSSDFEPIRRIDNTPLFTDEQLEVLEEFANARKDAETAKSASKREAAAAKIAKGTDLYNKVLEMTGQALDYLKNEANVLDLAKEITYKPWDEETTRRVQEWIDEVTLVNLREQLAAANEGKDSSTAEPTPPTAPMESAAPAAPAAPTVAEEKEEDLPF